jgi:uncharacterized protein YbjT (DUF2867 family)
MESSATSPKVTIAGATGFVGARLLKDADPDWVVRGLTRRAGSTPLKGFEWRQADLFSLQSAAQSLADTDVAIYLVHSMLPSTRLFQGNFADTDLLLADNFARSCLKNGVKQIIYLGGLLPEGKASKHLESRREVEEVFRATGIPCTIFRAGMVAGAGGSSFEILRNLVQRLPAMILPQWAQVSTQAIYIDDLVRVLLASVMNSVYFGKTINIVNGERLTYGALIRTTAAALGKTRLLVPVPIRSTAFSKRWVSFFGGTSYELVSPLIDSLLCELPSEPPEALIAPLIRLRSFRGMLDLILKEPYLRIRKRKAKKSRENTVRSIQRLPSLPQLDCNDIARRYEAWLPGAMWGIVRVHSEPQSGHVSFFLRGLPWPLLVLQPIFGAEKDARRVKFHIVGGVLTRRQDSGWLEFRQVADKKYTLVCIHEFVPALPWFIYLCSQALLHKQVMMAFARELRRQP